MKPPRIDFSLSPLPGEPTPRRPLRPLERSLLVTALALLVGAWGVSQVMGPVPEASSGDDVVAEVVDKDATAVPNAPPDALHDARELVHFPWLQVLEALESGLQPGVEVSALELRATDMRLKLSLRADGAELALSMAGRLARSPGLAGLRIHQQDLVGAGTDAAALQLSLEGPVPAAPWRRSDMASLGRPRP